MKLIIIFLTVSLVQVSAASFGQRITLNKINMPLDKVINEIREQSGYDFFYNKQVIKLAKPVTINVKNATITEVLEKCFDNQSLTYKLEEKAVIITVKEKSFFEDIIAQFQKIDIKGQVLDEKGQPLSGATVNIKGSRRSVVTGNKGEFALSDVAETATLIISYIGYKTKEVAAYQAGPIVIRLEPVTADLQEISVVSTGYQNIPKERATGSFELVDNKTLNLVTGTNILKRLQGNVTGFDFNNQKFATSSSDPNKPGLLSYLTIRGQNTLYGSSSSGSRVLVVVDGVEMVDNGSKYTEDQIGKLNPNDVENITILRDAAAESVYGSRAANGVIVITTKKGKFNAPTQISINSNVTITEKPDLFYQKRITTADVIEIQKFLYSKDNYYGLTPPEPYNFIYPQGVSPLVPEILDQQKRGLITADQANAQLAGLAKNDVRNDINKYFQRNAALYSNNLAISGGSNDIAYRLSVGYDKNLNNTVTSKDDRLSINYNMGVKPLKNLDIQTNLSYIQTNKNDQSGVSVFYDAGTPTNNYLMPYDQLADANGNPLSIIRLNGGLIGNYRPGYVDTVGAGHLLDMHYKPLQDIYDGYRRTKAQDVVLNVNATYKLSEAFSGNVVYGLTKSATNSVDYQSPNSYFSRWLMNYFTSDPTSATPYKQNIPSGGVSSPTVDNLVGQSFRGQLNLNKTWDNKHNIIAVAGAAFYISKSTTRNDLYFGYDENSLTYYPKIDYNSYLPTFGTDGSNNLLDVVTPYVFPVPGITDNNIRTTKAYFNMAYTYKNLYTLSGSIAKDASNIFGADANKSFKPYYHAGARWNINNEQFYGVPWLPTLGFRATFGYNGNLNYTYKPNAYIVYSRYPDQTSGAIYGTINGATNRQLRPEKTGILNLGLDFGFQNNRITGSIEVYRKWNRDLIGPNNIDRSTGFATQNFNTADMRGQGVDIILNSINIKTADFNWSSNFLFSHNKVKITKIYVNSIANSILIVGLNPFMEQETGDLMKLAGSDVNSLYAFRWAGLNHDTGMPQGYVDGLPSTDYNSIMYATGDKLLSSVRYMGSASPVYYGSFRNTFSYKSFAVSANILYKLGYYFRRPMSSTISYNQITSSSISVPVEYYRRWQKPGDEQFTNVPAFTYPTSSDAVTFYQDADINVLRGDHIRLQSISLSYNLPKTSGILKNTYLYGNIQNLGILWRANKQGIDPDIYDLPLPRIYGFGLSKTF